MHICFHDRCIFGSMSVENLIIQANYARSINKLVIYDSNKKCFLDSQNNRFDVYQVRILIRSDYEHFVELERILKKEKAILIETTEDREKIQNWTETITPMRNIYNINLNMLSNNEFMKTLFNRLSKNKDIFVKTKQKGFSKLISFSNFSQDPINSLIDFIEYGFQDFIISETIDICEDNYGKIEIRIIVINHVVMNASRYIHSLLHDVPKDFIDKAVEITEKIKENDNFPENYVLDLALIKNVNTEFIDIVEINPISTAMCYVQNSIFKRYDPPSFGIEYLYDMKFNPEKYDLNAIDNKNYSYEKHQIEHS